MVPQINDPHKYLEIPGDTVFELPPLILSGRKLNSRQLELCSEMAFNKGSQLVSSLDFEITERQITELGINFLEMYFTFRYLWGVGNAIFEWIEQCRNCGTEHQLTKHLGRIWPNNLDLYRFCNLCSMKFFNEDTAVCVGTRRMFDRCPPLKILSPEILLSQKEVARAYFGIIEENLTTRTLFPPERFSFQVITL